MADVADVDLRLVRADRPAAPAPELDADQRRVVEHRGGPLLVLAGPGTGKTTTLVEAVVDRVDRDGLDPERVLVLTFSRRAAAELRDRIAVRLGRTVREPLARTFHSYAFGLLRREAVRDGLPQPRLLSGAEQDLLIRDLLRGELEELGVDYWPEFLRPALPTRGFAEELRDLLMRSIERGLSPDDLAALGRRAGRDDWVAVARFASQYAGVTALRQPPAYDPAELVRTAVDLLRSDPTLLAAERSDRAFVVVDEYQDADPAQEELLALLAGGGRDLVVVGDPDQSIYGFRGADPDVIRRFPERFRTADGSPAQVRALPVSRRGGAVLLDASRRVAARLGGASPHRQLRAATSGLEGPGDRSSVHVLASANQEAAFIARELRSAHLNDGVPWQQMAVLVRSAHALPTLRRGLSSAGVPVNIRRDEVPLVDQPPVRALLDVLELATGRRELTAELAFSLVTGPLGGADPLALRRLRQELRRQEVAGGGGRASGQLLVEALSNPAELTMLDDRAVAPAQRVGDLLAAGSEAAGAAGATAEDVLWAVWSRTGLAERWSRAALGAGSAGAAADRDLDAVVALFDTVARFVDRLPGEGPAGFVEHLRGQQIPADSLSAGAPEGPAVALLTAHAAKGLEWDVVAVAGVQEGVWPDLRMRGTLLGTESLVDLAAGRNDSPVERHTARLAEERRLFYVAITRARRRLIVTASDAEESAPSRFLDELDPLDADAARSRASTGERPTERVPRGLDLPSLVAELRRVVCDPSAPAARRGGAARQLARLAAAGVGSAAPDQWYGLPELTDDQPLRGPDDEVRVSPSKVEEYHRCALRWMLKSCGATDGDLARAGVGSLVHDLAEYAAVSSAGVDELVAELDRRWPALDFGSGWVSRREYDRVRAMVERLARWIEANPRTFLAAEEDFDVRIGRARVVGRVDRLEADRQGRPVVIDFKTGTNKVREADLPQHPQLGTYQLAVQHGAFDRLTGGVRDPGGATLVQLQAHSRGSARDQLQLPLADADDPGWAESLLSETADGMAGASFAAEENPWCGFCPARTSCPVHSDGAQVSP
ncbi:MAG TPA: ATP-dependent DNA helicase [Jiangellaceae bacterium]